MQADEFDLKTFLTFSQPVQVPGAVLQPNVKYVLRRVDHGTTDIHVLRVLNAEENKVLSTFFGISDERLEPADHTVITFYETSPGYTKPVHEWFYPGRTIGYELIYPKEKMTEITAHLGGAHAAEVKTAQTETQTVTPQAPAEESQMAQNEENKESEVQREKPAEVTPAPAPEPTPAPAVSEEKSTTAAEQNNNAPAELPKTAGELPLIGLLGLAALGLRKVLHT